MSVQNHTVLGMGNYSDGELASAVAESHSWRGVLRYLGLPATSASALRTARADADQLGLNYEHFRGSRTWTEEQLRNAVSQSRTWEQVCQALGLSGGATTAHLRGHATRLGYDFSHFRSRQRGPIALAEVHKPDLTRLPRTGALLAAAWFELCGYSVAWPLEPCRYDLLASMDDRTERIQVKTTRHRSGASWIVRLATTRKVVHTYDPDEIDYFFVVDGDFNLYLIPIHVVGGLHNIQLSAYTDFRVRGFTAGAES